MKGVVFGAVVLSLLAVAGGCGGGGLNGNWTCQTQGQNGAVTLNLECRSDGTVVFNGNNFGAKWSGNHTILVPLEEDGMNESAQLLRMMADAVVNENGTVVDEKELASINKAAYYRPQPDNIRFSLTETQRKELFADLIHASDKYGKNLNMNNAPKACKDEWHRLATLKLKSQGATIDQQVNDILSEGYNSSWSTTTPTTPASVPAMSPEDAKNKLKTLLFRIPVKWTDSDHIDLGGVKKSDFSLPAFGFTRTK
jgi:hypothetical protein